MGCWFFPSGDNLENMRLSHGAFVGDVFAVQLVRLNNKQDLVLAGKLKRLRQHSYIFELQG